MRQRLTTFVLLFLIAVAAALSQPQERPEPVSLVQLVASPEKFSGKPVIVRGFLLISGPHDVVAFTLFLHREDAENNLGNSVNVLPNEEMKKNQEKIDRMYVQIAGTVRSVRLSGTEDSHVSTLADVKSCVLWSDPSRPVALKLLDGKSK